MELKAVERGKDRMKIEVRNETYTFLNLLREKAWESGCDQASYIIEHPYHSNPVVIVKSRNPIRVLADAGTKVTDQAKEFSRHFSRLSR